MTDKLFAILHDVAQQRFILGLKATTNVAVNNNPRIFAGGYPSALGGTKGNEGIRATLDREIREESGGLLSLTNGSAGTAFYSTTIKERRAAPQNDRIVYYRFYQIPLVSGQGTAHYQGVPGPNPRRGVLGSSRDENEMVCTGYIPLNNFGYTQTDQQIAVTLIPLLPEPPNLNPGNPPANQAQQNEFMSSVTLKAICVFIRLHAANP